MGINENNLKNALSEKYISLLDSERGTATNLAKTIGKKPSFVSEIKRGNPVNALHLIAVARLFGTERMLRIMGINKKEENPTRGTPHQADPLAEKLAELRTNNPAIYATVETYITGAYDAAKAMGGKSWKVYKAENVVQESKADGTNG